MHFIGRFIYLICFLVSLVVAIVCIAVWSENRAIRDAAVQGQCNILQDVVVSSRCSYSCNCDDSNHCHTCYRNCWEGDVIVNVFAQQSNGTAIISNFAVNVYTSQWSYADAYNYLSINYPAGSTTQCFFTLSPLRVFFQMPAVEPFFIASMTFFGITGFILILFSIVELCGCSHRRYHYTQY